jgi:hypothetical protein
MKQRKSSCRVRSYPIKAANLSVCPIFFSYSLSNFGRVVTSAEAEIWLDFVEIIVSILLMNCKVVIAGWSLAFADVSTMAAFF